jgi:hypothetical protein
LIFWAAVCMMMVDVTTPEKDRPRVAAKGRLGSVQT